MPQSRFGPYEILALLGSGGMGDVYRAKDPRLRREVALKILAREAGGDLERQQRFLQEARAASALNHPNILVVYDVGSENGVPYIVSELVDGDPLRTEMKRGAMPLKRLLDVAVQIADGLAAAHDAGIVHRDLKPENVMLTREGRVKIVDFGLAELPTFFAKDVVVGSDTLSEAGLLVGTIPYMSPEQARGEPANFRSDQFSVGLMLYELATGKHPLRRQTAVQTLSAIIGEEPQWLSHANAKLPAPLRWLIERCLAKDPRQRYAATRDLYHDLVTLREHLTEITRTDAVALRQTVGPPGRRLAAAIVVFASLAVVLLAVFWFYPEAPDPSAYRFTPLATDSEYQGSPAWSPDGKTLTYVAETAGIVQVFTRNLTSSMRAQITQSHFDCRDPFWSPDGTRIFYISAARDKDGLWSVSAAGGTPEIVVEDVINAAISPDGKTLAFFREEGAEIGNWRSLWLSSPPGAEPRRYTRTPFNARFSDAVVRFSPDGSRIGVWGAIEHEEKTGTDADGPRAFWIIPLPDGDPYTVNALSNLPPTWPSFSWLPDSRHIVATILQPPTPGTHLWLLDTQGSGAWPVTFGVESESLPAVSPDGDKVAFNSEHVDFDLAEIPIDGSPAKTLLATSRNEMDPVWSPVGAQYAFVTDRMGNQQIWLRSREGQWERPIVTEKDFGATRTYVLNAPTFSPDGQRIAYVRQGATSRIWISTLAGGPPVQLLTQQIFQDAPNWSPDGNWIVYLAGSSGRYHLAKAPVGGGPPPVVIKSDINVMPYTRPQWSPDGRWIACNTLEGLLLLSPEGGAPRVLSEANWLAFGWSADALHVYGLRQRDDDRRLMLASIDIRTGRERIIAPDLGPVPLANFPVRGFTWISEKSFATSLVRVRSDVWLLEGFRARADLSERFWPRRIALQP